MTDTTKRIILLTRTSTYRARPFVEAAKRLNVEVVQGLDIHPDLAKEWHVTLPLQFEHPTESAAQIVSYARQKPVQAILAVDDSATLIAALACEQLGLPHNPSQAAYAARNKYEMRRQLLAGGALCPQFNHYHLNDDPTVIAATTTYPCVLKPLILSGSRGVIRANNPQEFQRAWQQVHHILSGLSNTTPAADQILVEAFIPGVEVALEGILNRGRLKILALFDKPDPLDGPYFEETIYVTPSRLPVPVQDEIAHATAQAVVALGLQQGPIHAELRVNQTGPWILEVAGRSIGGLCAQTLHFGHDVSLEELILRQAIGLEIDHLTRQQWAEGVMMIPIPEAGILTGVHGLEAAKAVPHITGLEITATLNHPLVPLPAGESYLGFIFARGQHPTEVETALRQAHQKLQFDIAPMFNLVG